MSYATKIKTKSTGKVAVEDAKSSAMRVRRHRTNKMIAQASELREGERKCTTIKSNGQRCGKYAIKGGFVCPTHGGSAPQVRAKANKRLLALVEPALVRLEDLMHQDVHPPTALGAIRTVLERAGSNTPIGALNKDPGVSKPSHVVNIGIAVGGITPDKLREMIQAAKLLPAAETAIEAQVTKTDEDDDIDDADV